MPGVSNPFLRLHIVIKLGHRGKRVYNFVALSARITRGLQADCDFALVMNLSFYRFGIRSCLATSHKQIQRRNAVWRHRTFWVSRQHGNRLELILFMFCLLYDSESPGESQIFLRQITAIWQVARNHCRGRPTARRPEIQREQRRRRWVRSSSSRYRAREWIKHGNNAK